MRSTNHHIIFLNNSAAEAMPQFYGI